MSPLKRFPTLIVKRSLCKLSHTSTRPQGVCEAHELLKIVAIIIYLIGDSHNYINNIRMTPLKCFPALIVK